MTIQTLAANMRSAFIDRKSAKIGGGIFTPEELKDGAIALNAFPDLLDALQRVMRHIPDNAGGASLSDDMHRAKKAIAKATGGQS